MKWPYYQTDVNQIIFEPHSSLKSSFTNIWGLRTSFVECESFLESNSPNSLALCVANLNESNCSGSLSVRGYLPLIRKVSATHMHVLAVYGTEGLPFQWELSLEISADSYLCFWLTLLHSVTNFFSLYRSPSSSWSTVFMLFHLTKMRFSQSTHLLMYLSLETLSSIIRTG